MWTFRVDELLGYVPHQPRGVCPAPLFVLLESFSLFSSSKKEDEGIYFTTIFSFVSAVREFFLLLLALVPAGDSIRAQSWIQSMFNIDSILYCSVSKFYLPFTPSSLCLEISRSMEHDQKRKEKRISIPYCGFWGDGFTFCEPETS